MFLYDPPLSYIFDSQRHPLKAFSDQEKNDINARVIFNCGFLIQEANGFLETKQ